ncbi:HTH-type transcriptional regulator BetI [Microbacterium sp. SA39]|nr:HTH-type transcriptional regulator BetI [Microbacterium sp. SA39]
MLSVSVQNIADRVGISRPGLLKHFASKEALLDAVALVFADETSLAMGSEALSSGVAERLWDQVDGYAALSAILLSRAMTGPDRAAAMAHHQRLLSTSPIGPELVSRPSSATDEGSVSDDVRLQVAVWEGFSVMSRYLPEMNPPALFARGIERGDEFKSVTPNIRPPALALDTLLLDRTGYEPGHRRREAIVSDAIAIFAENGFGGTTMKEISERVNVAPSTLRHHFSSKTELFAEVMRQRDNALVARRAGVLLDPAEELLAIGAEATRDAEVESGLIGLYAVLSTEAVSPKHPVHRYFQERFVRTIAYFENLFARTASDRGLDLDARFEAIWLIALWDGLQYQSMLEEVFTPFDLPRILGAHISEVLQRGESGISSAAADSSIEGTEVHRDAEGL